MKGLNKGFTYIEFLVYIGLFTLILVSIIPFAWNVIGGNAKSATEQEVFANYRSIDSKISYAIRNASGINSVAATSISLANTDASQNPTVIDLSGGNIRIKKGVSSAINLNSAKTTVSSLTFTNYTSGGNETKHISWQYTISANYGSARQEYTESVNSSSSAELRSN